MLKEVYKEQILKIINFLNSDIKKKEIKIRNLEEENKAYVKNFNTLKLNFSNLKNKFNLLNGNFNEKVSDLENNLTTKNEIRDSLEKFSLLTEKKVIELEEELTLKNKQIKKYEDKIKKLERYNVVIWILLLFIIFILLYSYLV